MTWPANATTRAVAKALAASHQAEHWQHKAVSWELSDGCYFCVVLSPGNPPIGGVAMPRVANRMYEILRNMGTPFEDWPDGFRFEFLTLLSLPLGFLTGKNEGAVRLNDGIHLDSAGLARIVDFVCCAKDKVREIAGTVDQALDFAREKMPWDRNFLYVAPVGYRVVGRLQESEKYLTDCRVHLQSGNNPGLLKMYDRFADQLRKATW